jgi:hypothetical protein
MKAKYLQAKDRANPAMGRVGHWFYAESPREFFFGVNMSTGFPPFIHSFSTSSEAAPSDAGKNAWVGCASLVAVSLCPPPHPTTHNTRSGDPGPAGAARSVPVLSCTLCHR